MCLVFPTCMQYHRDTSIYFCCVNSLKTTCYHESDHELLFNNKNASFKLLEKEKTFFCQIIYIACNKLRNQKFINHAINHILGMFQKYKTQRRLKFKMWKSKAHRSIFCFGISIAGVINKQYNNLYPISLQTDPLFLAQSLMMA